MQHKISGFACSNNSSPILDNACKAFPITETKSLKLIRFYFVEIA